MAKPARPALSPRWVRSPLSFPKAVADPFRRFSALAAPRGGIASALPRPSPPSSSRPGGSPGVPGGGRLRGGPVGEGARSAATALGKALGPLIASFPLRKRPEKCTCLKVLLRFGAFFFLLLFFSGEMMPLEAFPRGAALGGVAFCEGLSRPRACAGGGRCGGVLLRSRSGVQNW